MANEQEDWELLRLANEKDKLALEVAPFGGAVGEALSRAFDEEWIRLIDVVQIPSMHPYKTFRIFKLTQLGKVRKAFCEMKLGVENAQKH